MFYLCPYFILQSICQKVEQSEREVEKLMMDVNRLKEVRKEQQAQIKAAGKQRTDTADAAFTATRASVLTHQPMRWAQVMMITLCYHSGCAVSEEKAD